MRVTTITICRNMSRVRLLVGTRKGAFILSSDGTRKGWSVPAGDTPSLKRPLVFVQIWALYVSPAEYFRHFFVRVQEKPRTDADFSVSIGESQAPIALLQVVPDGVLPRLALCTEAFAYQRAGFVIRGGPGSPAQIQLFQAVGATPYPVSASKLVTKHVIGLEVLNVEDFAPYTCRVAWRRGGVRHAAGPRDGT